MLFIKKTSKIIVLSMLLCCGLNSCNDDSTAEVENPINENLSELITDEQFLDFVDEILAVSFKVVDSRKASDLLNRNSPLTTEEKEELANAMGFESVPIMQIHLDKQRIKYKDISERFDIENQNNRKELNEIYHSTIKKVLANKNKSLKNMSKDGNCSDLCLDSYYAYIPPNEIALKHFVCGDTCSGNEEGEGCLRCHTTVELNLSLFEAERLEILRCCEIDCKSNPTNEEIHSCEAICAEYESLCYEEPAH